METAIIGAGISGLALGQLCEKSLMKYQIFEENPRPGGLIQCDLVDNFLYHKVGGHVFNSKDERVLEWFWKFFDKQTEFINVQRNSKILLEKKIVGYPIENHIYQLEPLLGKAILNDLLSLDTDSKELPENFKDFLFKKFGKTLCNIYFIPYNQKIWKTDLSKISMEWLEGKLPNPSLSEIINSNVYRKNEKKTVHSSFYYPKTGGSQFIVDRLSTGLNLKCNIPVHSISKVPSGILVNNDFFDRLVYTGDVRKLRKLIKFEDKNLSFLLDRTAMLGSHGTSNMLCECDPCDFSWLYLPQIDLKAHRVIYTGGFAQSNNGRSSRSSCVVEFSGQLSDEEMAFESHKLPGNLRPIAFNRRAASYVIQDYETRTLIRELKASLENYGVYLLGRFAEWEYYNMDTAIAAAMKLMDEKLSVRVIL